MNERENEDIVIDIPEMSKFVTDKLRDNHGIVVTPSDVELVFKYEEEFLIAKDVMFREDFKLGCTE